MTLEERADLVLSIARVLYVNGQSTDQTLVAAQSVGHSLGLDVRLMPRWGELQLEFQGAYNQEISVVAADPNGVDMDRVVAASRVVESLATLRLTPAAAETAISAIAEAPPGPTWLFTIAAAAGSVALAVIFGLQHLLAAALIFVSAAAGAVARRGLAHFSANVFLQPFCAALLAGIVGALGVRYQLNASMRLVAVCPCMVLVPGPAILNGALDLVKGRIHLGSARIVYAGLVLVMICTGLLLGLALLGTSLPIDQASRTIPLWFDMIAAGVAVAAYGIFFSMPLRMLAWPIAVGMLAHAVRWWLFERLGASAAIGALIACLLVALILTPVARHWHMPFAAIGFASVVSMIPGVFLFRMASGLVQLADGKHTTLLLISGTIADGMNAITIILAMSLGLLLPKLSIDALSERQRPVRN